MAYAETTKVPVHQTVAEIERLTTRHGGNGFAMATNADFAQVEFQAHGRRIRFRVPLAASGRKTQMQADQFRRARWRALLLTVKAKFESIESGIETFEDAFLANIVLPDGSTVSDNARPAIAASYDSGTMAPLLPAPGEGR